MITINGLKKSSSARDIAALLETEGYAGKIVAVARNGSFVPRAEYANTNLENGDDIEIVAPMQGG
jgi:sulfur carrier protein